MGAVDAADALGALTPSSSNALGIALSNTANSFTSVNITGAGAVTVANGGALTVAGVSTTGDILISTHTGNLTVAGTIATVATNATALTLEASPDDLGWAPVRATFAPLPGCFAARRGHRARLRPTAPRHRAHGAGRRGYVTEDGVVDRAVIVRNSLYLPAFSLGRLLGQTAPTDALTPFLLADYGWGRARCLPSTRHYAGLGRGGA